MYYILYSDKDNNLWEIVDGEDAMNIRVDELCREYNLDADQDIVVFDVDYEPIGDEEERIKKAEQCLAENGVDPDEVSTVLQAIGYVLLDTELYPD